jgi:hypothetical protein
MAQIKFMAKNVIFKAKNINASVNKDSVIKEVVAEANRFVSDPANVVDGSKHTFTFQQEEEIPVAIYAPEELIDSDSCELRIRQGHKGKVSYVTKFSNVKNPLTTKTVLVSWIFDSNSQYKSVLVINAQPARETPLELFYSEFTPNRIVKDENGKETMPYLGWEKDQVLAWFKDESKLRGCVLALTEEEYQKSSDWVRGDKFFNITLPEKEEKKEEESTSEPDVTPFLGNGNTGDEIDIYCDIADILTFAMLNQREQPFKMMDDIVVDDLRLDEENLNHVLEEYLEDGGPSSTAGKTIGIIKENQEAFLDLAGEIMCIIDNALQTAIDDPRWNEVLDDDEAEEWQDAGGPGFDTAAAVEQWVKDQDGSNYSETYRKLASNVAEEICESNEYLTENYLDWLR